MMVIAVCYLLRYWPLMLMLFIDGIGIASIVIRPCYCWWCVWDVDWLIIVVLNIDWLLVMPVVDWWYIVVLMEMLYCDYCYWLWCWYCHWWLLMKPGLLLLTWWLLLVLLLLVYVMMMWLYCVVICYWWYCRDWWCIVVLTGNSVLDGCRYRYYLNCLVLLFDVDDDCYILLYYYCWLIITIIVVRWRWRDELLLMVLIGDDDYSIGALPIHWCWRHVMLSGIILRLLWRWCCCGIDDGMMVMTISDGDIVIVDDWYDSLRYIVIIDIIAGNVLLLIEYRWPLLLLTIVDDEIGMMVLTIVYCIGWHCWLIFILVVPLLQWYPIDDCYWWWCYYWYLFIGIVMMIRWLLLDDVVVLLMAGSDMRYDRDWL